jgi:hypothetical protein
MTNKIGLGTETVDVQFNAHFGWRCRERIRAVLMFSVVREIQENVRIIGKDQGQYGKDCRIPQEFSADLLCVH